MYLFRHACDYTHVRLDRSAYIRCLTSKVPEVVNIKHTESKLRFSIAGKIHNMEKLNRDATPPW